MDAILKMLPLDKAKFSEQAISFLKNNSIDDNKKAILSKYLSSFDKEAKMSVGMHAALFPHEAIPPEVSSDASKSTLIDLTKSQNRAK